MDLYAMLEYIIPTYWMLTSAEQMTTDSDMFDYLPPDRQVIKHQEILDSLVVEGLAEQRGNAYGATDYALDLGVEHGIIARDETGGVHWADDFDPEPAGVYVRHHDKMLLCRECAEQTDMSELSRAMWPVGRVVPSCWKCSRTLLPDGAA
jgi:hypothetical protein